jgi:hypothetical protein
MQLIPKRLRWKPGELITLESGTTARCSAPPACNPGDMLVVDLEECRWLDPFALAVVVAQARRQADLGVGISICASTSIPSNRFAMSMGLRDVLEGYPPKGAHPERTIPLTKLKSHAEMHTFAATAARSISPDDPEIAAAAEYCLIELIRNVFDHSQSSPIVCAQRMEAGRFGRAEDTIQVAVADGGVGMLSTLERMHGWVETDSMAVDAGLMPHISGTFPKGALGRMQDNAGLGLFFVSEFVKLVDGRMLVWTGEHLRVLVGDVDAELGYHSFPAKTFPLAGTAVAFELSIGLLDDYTTFFAHLREELERHRTPTVAQETVFRRVATPSPDARQTLVRYLSEDTIRAREHRVDHLIPRVRRSSVVCLDFRGLKAMSPSFAHALFYETLREASIVGCTLECANTNDAVWEALRQVEGYALDAPSFSNRGPANPLTSMPEDERV